MKGSLLRTLLCLAPLVAQGGEIATVPLSFTQGQTTAAVTGRIVGYEIIDYTLEVSAGQVIQATLSATNDSAYFNILPPGEDSVALFVGSSQGNSFIGALPESGAYRLRVYLMRSAARRGEGSDFELDVSLFGPDFADGLSGGPDYYKVRLNSSGGRLNLRGAPTLRAEALSWFQSGDILQNKGCIFAEGRRWCNVAQGMHDGWVAGEFLAEASGPDALVPGTGYHATGSLRCSVAGQDAECPFGAMRRGDGSGTINVTLPGGAERVIRFENHMPTGYDGGASMQISHAVDFFTVVIGDAWIEIAEAVMTGG
ncbi:hypothetical protein C8N32_10794 [Rhodovulum imhoffii]|uniref:SH3 domain-containing protein n=1 Tax=Rhodovulum imhoffii TaxID=365340 RepID=A0A2T5BSL7_9RHOB|nr:hypothetical protein [Rhodovulum imhoffii]MBK5933435.1 hypothetical protein [Rhodovulum imhoffii]PTN02328.1 hypothetical protein C8N32_10794 [Rhodovulum imhoffii]